MDLVADLEQADVEEVGIEILREAVFCVERTRVKASDSIHIATALRTRVDLFITADIQQAKAAEMMGLKVERVG
jgi:predicted nucleic acid-binding protein